MVSKRSREEDLDDNQNKRQKIQNTLQDEKLSKVFSDFMGSYLKLNWVNEDDNPHIPPKYVLSDMIMEKFFKEAKWREVADSRDVVAYINKCLGHHGMKNLDQSNFPKAYNAWASCVGKDFSSEELDSAKVLCSLRSVLRKTEDSRGNSVSNSVSSSGLVANAEEEIETKPELGGQMGGLDHLQQVQQDLRKEEQQAQAQAQAKNMSHKLAPVIPQEISAPMITETQVNRMPPQTFRYNAPASQPRYQQHPPHPQHYQQAMSAQQHSQQQQQQQQSQVVPVIPSRRPGEIFEDKKIQFAPKKNLFDLQVLNGGQWHILGSFHTHADAVTAFKCIRTVVLQVLPQSSGMGNSALIANNHPPQTLQNLPAATVPSSNSASYADQHKTTTVVYQLPTQKVIQLIHRLPSINLSDPWQLTQLVCLYLCLFARISIKCLCSLRETHVTVNTSGNLNGVSGEPSKPFVTVVGLNPMCMKHLKCMCSEAHDMCNVLCVVTVLTLYQNQKNDVGNNSDQAFVRGIALAPNGISRCLTNTPLRQTNKLQLGGWLSKITKKFN